MNQKQVEALRLMVRKESLAAVLEAEVLLRDERSHSRTSITHYIDRLRYETEKHAKEVIE